MPWVLRADLLSLGSVGAGAVVGRGVGWRSDPGRKKALHGPERVALLLDDPWTSAMSWGSPSVEKLAGSLRRPRATRDLSRASAAAARGRFAGAEHGPRGPRARGPFGRGAGAGRMPPADSERRVARGRERKRPWRKAKRDGDRPRGSGESDERGSSARHRRSRDAERRRAARPDPTRSERRRTRAGSTPAPLRAREAPGRDERPKTASAEASRRAPARAAARQARGAAPGAAIARAAGHARRVARTAVDRAPALRR